MKRIFLLSAATIVSMALSAQTAKRMDDLKPEQKSMAVSLKLTGDLTTEGNSDYRQLRDLCFQMREVDLSEANSTILPNNAFHSRHQLQSIVLPNVLKSIGSQAFFNCDKLQSITIPASVDEIKEAAFSGCSALEELTIKGCPKIGAFAFARLSGLKTLRVDSKTPPKADASAFYGIDRSSVRIIVPKGTIAAYKKAEGWNHLFGNVKEAYEVGDPASCLTPAPSELNIVKNAKPVKMITTWNIMAEETLANEADMARNILTQRMGNIANSRMRGLQMQLCIDNSLADDEAYTLNIDESGVNIKGKTAKGVFYGIMTLDQLLRGSGSKECVDALPQLTINDCPRTHVRELMVDPARIFIPFDELKAFVPEMARYKLNALHLHLVDDQAWRIEIKKYPQLTEQASSRWGQDDLQMPIKGYYTQEQMRELVSYAAKYHIDVVPEIEMPGHEVAAISVFPELTCHQRKVPVRTTCGVSNELLCPGNDFTYEFLGNVFKELADIFPSKYIHLGGDEAGNPPLDCWTDCPKCQTLKKSLGITSNDRSENWRLQKYLFDRMITLLRDTYGKTPMFWYESDFKEIQPGCVTFAWRSGQTKEALDAAVSNNARIMLCPGEHCYFDYPMAKNDMPEVNWGMPVTSLKDAYSLDPAWGMGEEFEKNNLFGVAGTLWSECINSPERVYYQAYPRAIALAEVGWSQPSVRSWEGFLTRLRPTMKDMMRRGVTCSLETGETQK